MALLAEDLARPDRFGQVGTGNKYFGKDVWTGDLVEENRGGHDHRGGDSAFIYAFAGHGIVRNGYFHPSLCTRTFGIGCDISSQDFVFGERTGPDVGAHPGKASILMFATCHSGDSSAPWFGALAYGGDYLLGYAGESSDTDNVAMPWAYMVRRAASLRSFKQAWFDANDIGEGDTAVVMAPGWSATSAADFRDTKNWYSGTQTRSSAWTWIARAFRVDD